MIKRIDPAGCGCTDCMTGYSRPLDNVSAGEVLAMLSGGLLDATSESFEVIVTVRAGYSGREIATVEHTVPEDADYSQPTDRLAGALSALADQAAAHSVLALGYKPRR